jgi:ankyrin repeat protein
MSGRSLVRLPLEIVLKVTWFLPLGDLASLVRTSRFFAQTLSPLLYHAAIFDAALSPWKNATRDFASLQDVLGIWQSGLVLDYFVTRAAELASIRDDLERTVLQVLVTSSNKNLLDAFLAACVEKGIDVDPRNGDGETPLHTAIRKSKPEAVLKLLAAGADPLARATEDGIPALSLVSQGFPEHVTQILLEAVQKAGGNINMPDKSGGQIPLHYAARRGDEDLVRFLIANGADVLATNNLGHQPLVTSIFAKFLHGADDLATNDSSISMKALGVGKILLNAMTPLGYDISTTTYSRCDIASPEWIPEDQTRFTEDGDTLLHLAVRLWDDTLVKFLLESGANPLAVNGPTSGRDGLTPFDIAVCGRAPQMVETIVTTVNDNNPPEFWTSNGHLQDGFEICVREAYPGTVRTLLDLRRAGKVNIDVKNELMLNTCSYYGDHCPADDINKTIKYVIEAGANVNARDENGKTALHLVCGHYNEEEGDDEDKKDKEPSQLLEIVKYLLDVGANWTLQDNEGNTALHDAWHESAMEHLVSVALASADAEALRLRNRQGRSVFDVAIWQDFTHTAKLLSDAGFGPNASHG